MTEEQKSKFIVMADMLDKDCAGLVKNLGATSRELSLAITKIEEASMWIRRAIDRAP